MITIGICDDEEKAVKEIHDNLTKVLFDVEDVMIETYKNGEEVINSIKNETFNCNLLLLDIFMEPCDGMDVASFIRENNVDVDIIFITNSTAHVYKGYIYKAFSYILKSRLEEGIKEDVLRYIEEISEMEDILNVTSEGVARRVPISKIIYVDSNARVLTLHLKNEDISFYAKMNDIEPVLAEHGFIRIHQSYMVKKKLVSAYGNTFVQIEDMKLPVSRKYSALLDL